MPDQDTPAFVPVPAEDAPSAPKKGKAAPEAVTDQRDFLDASEAAAVADRIGGTVEHIGVAFHVSDPS